jgi:hypothetical protein
MLHIITNATYNINILIDNLFCHSLIYGVKFQRPNYKVFLCSFRLTHRVSVNFEHANNYYALESFHHVDVGSIADVSEIALPTTTQWKDPISLTHGAEPFLKSHQLCSYSRISKTFYGTWTFIAVFTRPLHWSLSWARSIQSTPSHPISGSLVATAWRALGCGWRRRPPDMEDIE